jgi:hypothetical protein
MYSVIARGERQKSFVTKSKVLGELGNNDMNNRDCSCKVGPSQRGWVYGNKVVSG